MKNIPLGSRGNALITLLFFALITIIVTSAAVVMIIVNSSAVTTMQQGNDAYSIAESGMENALLRLLRNPSYTSEVLTIGDGTATITVTGTTTKTIISRGRIGNFERSIQVTATYVNNILTVTAWDEIPQ